MSRVYYIGTRVKLIREPDHIPMESDGIEVEVDEYDANRDELDDLRAALVGIARLPALARKQAN